MGISVFVSRPTPHKMVQQAFLDKVTDYLKIRGLSPRTLGGTDYDTDAPLVAIRRLIKESNGIITIAFRRALIVKGENKAGDDINTQPDIEKNRLDDKWTTSPYCHIETAMAFQEGLPALILREKDVIEDGVLEKGVIGVYLSEFYLDDKDIKKSSGEIDKKALNKKINAYLEKEEWKQMIAKREGRVRSVAENKGKPPQLY